MVVAGCQIAPGKPGSLVWPKKLIVLPRYGDQILALLHCNLFVDLTPAVEA
jgi:hypothetical protein